VDFSRFGPPERQNGVDLSRVLSFNRPAKLDLSNCHFDLAPRRLFSGECSPNRILNNEELEIERNAFADPIAYVAARNAQKNKMT
jgi:hypothetical protein